MKAEVSIVIPVYNGAEFVKSAYAQIKGQQLKNAEIIFVDNNSTDDTYTQLEELRTKDEKVQILKEPKQGAAAARNKGLSQVTGEYVYFFDVDDTLMPNALSHLLEVLQGHPKADSVFGLGTKKKGFRQDRFDKALLSYPKPFWGLYWFNNFSTLTGTPSFLHRKRVFDKVGMFPEELLLGEDAAFHIKLGLHCEIVHTNNTIFYYHRHKNSTVSRNNKKRERVYTYWEQYVKFYINYYTNLYPEKQFGILLRQKLWLAIVRMLLNESSVKERKKTYADRKKDIKPLKIPGFLNFLFTILIFFPLTLYAKVLVKMVKTMYPENVNLQKAKL